MLRIGLRKGSLIVRASVIAASCGALCTSGLGAEGVQQAPTSWSPELNGGATVVAQTVNDDRARSEAVGSLDVFFSAPIRGLSLFGYVEANTTPLSNGVSRLVEEANTDAGTALTRRRRGRVQLSELRLVMPVARDLRGHVGLLDATGFLDVSRIANDENLYFIGVPFVNNPTIEFPDYALGLAVDGAVPGTESWEIGGVFSGSNGLADNPNVSYAQLINLTDEGKGVFAGVSARWVGNERRFTLGGWVNTAQRERLDGSGTVSRRGAYAVAGWFRGEHSVSARGGLAAQSATVASSFLGLTYLWSRSADAVGAAFGLTGASPDAVDAADMAHAELFVRRHLIRGVFVTASLQHIANSGFDRTGARIGSRLWIPGIRLSSVF